MSELTLQPIGYIRTGKQVKFQALHQPSEQLPEHNVLELLPDQNYEQALRDLAGFSAVPPRAVAFLPPVHPIGPIPSA